MRTIPCQAGGNLLEAIALQKTIARRFISLGIPREDAVNFAIRMDESNLAIIVRKEGEGKPDFIILVKHKH
jgi:hypothetical protein